jgi:signal transduction histidine kinase
VVEKAVGLVSNLIKKSTNNFKVAYMTHPPLFRGNAQRLEQVIINLVMNACQALPDNDKGVRISTGKDESGSSVYVDIQDQGVGIPPEKIQQITDPFFTTKRDGGGTGLGLAISDRIVRDHQGRMNFSSTPGKGTHVRISFPVQTFEKESEGRDV